MKKLILATLLLISGYSQAQFFESQLAFYNPAYTGMMDDRFADFNMSSFGFRRSYNSNHFNGSYQQNFDNLNSGFGVDFGYSRLNFDDFRWTTFYTSLSYRYALSFESGLRLAGGARLGYTRFDVTDNQQFGLDDSQGFHVQLGGMASIKNFTLGFALPVYGDAFNSFGINASYRIMAGERVEFTVLSGTFFQNDRFEQNLRIKSDFNQKFWLALGARVVNDRNFNQQHLSYGLHMGYRIKQHFHIMIGTDFGFSNKSFNFGNPKIGLVYQWKK
jgi:hypothetical protein